VNKALIIIYFAVSLQNLSRPKLGTFYYYHCCNACTYLHMYMCMYVAKWGGGGRWKK